MFRFGKILLIITCIVEENNISSNIKMKGCVSMCVFVCPRRYEIYNKNSWKAQSCTLRGFNGRRFQKSYLYGTEIEKM